MRRSLSWSLLSFFVVLGSSAAAAQDAPEADRAALQITFDHGVTQTREPGQDVDWTGALAVVDMRLYAPSGFGGLIRGGVTFGGPFILEADTGAAYRAWLTRSGPRGLSLGGALGFSTLWNEPTDPALGLGHAAGGFVTVQIDYHEHGFVVGVGYHYRWLPVRDHEEVDTFTLQAFARVGGELPF